MIVFCGTVIISLIVAGEALSRIDPLVNTDLGLIQGVRADDGDYAMFKGIPYAQVNASNPFGVAIPQEPFEGVFVASDDTSICPQFEQYNNTLVGTLDCLHLNIYVPDTASSRNKLPVLIWLYGGAFSVGFAGSHTYGPRFLVRHDIILITLNYRLGPYGFMCLDTPDTPGNAGLKDQLIALRWIKRNIESFGGDSNKITLSGVSSGALSTDFHLLSPQEKLFDQAILQSGTTLKPTFSTPVKDAPLQLATYLGFATDNIDEAISILASIDSDIVIAAASELRLTFKPCVEKQFDGVESVVVENWINAPVAKVRDMPILIGFNNNEKLWTYLDRPESYYEDRDIFNDILRIGFDIDDPSFVGMKEVVQEFYLGDKDVSVDTMYEIHDFNSDFEYSHPTYRSINKYFENNVGNIYHYIFSYSGDRNFMKRIFNHTANGAYHADEVGYLFDISFYDRTPSPQDQLIIDRITTLWANFVKFGNPTPEISELIPIQWQPITENSLRYYLDIDTELYLGTRPLQQRMAFWDLFYMKNGHLQIIYPEED